MWCGTASPIGVLFHRTSIRARSESIEQQLDLAPNQGRVDLIDVAVQGHGRGLGHGAEIGPQERFPQQCWAGQIWASRRGAPPPCQRRLAGLVVDPLVVDGLYPCRKQGIHLIEAGHHGACACRGVVGGNLDQELAPAPVENQRSILRPWGRPGRLWVSRIAEHPRTRRGFVWRRTRSRCPSTDASEHRR